eukprot:g1717.t1
MKFAKYLESNLNPEWREQYIAYDVLKKLIKEAQLSSGSQLTAGASSRTTSLTVCIDRGDKINEEFFTQLNNDVSKVSQFTEHLMDEISQGVDRIRQILDSTTQTPAHLVRDLTEEATNLGQRFIAAEKYVNLNYLGFHKILKKHDKKLPLVPCYQFYLAHLHEQPWTQGGYSDLIVKLSDIHSRLRQDSSGVKDDGAAQGFIRSTQKFWVHSQDISTVKHHILQNLPVFRFDKDQFDGDSQLVSSVYFDNSLLELYHGRLDKKPGAIAIRIRWYGPHDPELVFIERKTHKEGWKGEVSVKERFTLHEQQVMSFLQGSLSSEAAVADLIERGKSKDETEKFQTLFNEVQNQIDSKQLVPFVRTSYMRTAFQIPYDSSVRISLDTNLRMMKENPTDNTTITSIMDIGRWFRDPALPVHHHEITSFPHGILEIKLSLREGQDVPQWVQDLLDSGYLTEVHKFSKFIHGTATLFPDQVQAVPYWVDDESIRQSMVASVQREAPEQSMESSRGSELTHPLLQNESGINLMTQQRQIIIKERKRAPHGGPADSFVARWFPFKGLQRLKQKSTVMRLEPKVFFANERTFMSWMEMAVTLGSISSILLGKIKTSFDSVN